LGFEDHFFPGALAGAGLEILRKEFLIFAADNKAGLV
jgi:hypothetical protein